MKLRSSEVIYHKKFISFLWTSAGIIVTWVIGSPKGPVTDPGLLLNLNRMIFWCLHLHNNKPSKVPSIMGGRWTKGMAKGKKKIRARNAKKKKIKSLFKRDSDYGIYLRYIYILLVKGWILNNNTARLHRKRTLGWNRFVFSIGCKNLAMTRGWWWWWTVGEGLENLF